MTDKKISELSPASALTGLELVEVVQSGNNFRTTTGDIADLVIVPTLTSQLTNDSGFISSVVQDTTPQLGGDLDTNGNIIINDGNMNFLPSTAPSAPVTAGETRMWSEVKNGFSQLKIIGSSGIERTVDGDLISIARNTTGSTIPAGSLVRFSGGTGNVPNIVLAQANGLNIAHAVTVQAINNNAFGIVLSAGTLNNVNTSAYSDGDILYLSASSAGVFTDTMPSRPNSIQKVGVVTNASMNGTIQMQFENIVRFDGEAFTDTVINGVTLTTGSGTSVFLRGDGTYATPSNNSAWGSITGTLSSQTDLQTALNNKLDDSQFSGLSKITVGTTAPSSPSVGDLWIDTN